MGKNDNIGLFGKTYGIWKTDFDTWAIRAHNVTCYLIEGNKKAMLIDTAYGEKNMRAVVESITNLPLIVVNTHAHFDHVGGNGFWPQVWMASEGIEEVKTSKFKRKLPFFDYEILSLEDGQEFDLGDRIVKAIAIGAHHETSFAFYDEKYKTLFTGDEIEAGQVLLNVTGKKQPSIKIIQRHMDNMLKLKRLYPNIARLMPAHNGSPLNPDYIDDYIALSESILSNHAKICKSVSGYGFPSFIWGGNRKLQKAEYGKASFVYRKA